MKLFKDSDFAIIYDDRPLGISLHGNKKDTIFTKLNSLISEEVLISISDVIKGLIKIDILFSIHPYIVSDFLKLSENNVRLSYSIAKLDWQFGEINNYYDLVLTQGRYSSYLIKSKFGIPCLEVGFPRYFNVKKQVVLKNKLNFVNNLPIVSFFPAIGSNSIMKIEKELLDLSNKFNFLIKVHPIEDDHYNHYYEYLSDKINVVFETQNDFTGNESIIINSDLTVHDEGGTCFSSLYFKKNFVFFEKDININKSFLDLNPDEILYLLFKSHLNKINFEEKLNQCLMFPLAYDKQLGKIRNIFFTNRAKINFYTLKILTPLLTFRLVKILIHSKILNKSRKYIYKVKLDLLSKKLIRTINLINQ